MGMGNLTMMLQNGGPDRKDGDGIEVGGVSGNPDPRRAQTKNEGPLQTIDKTEQPDDHVTHMTQ